MIFGQAKTGFEWAKNNFSQAMNDFSWAKNRFQLHRRAKNDFWLGQEWVQLGEE